MIERAVAHERAPALRDADRARRATSPTRRGVPLGDAGLRGVDRDRARAGPPPHPVDELVPPRASAATSSTARASAPRCASASRRQLTDTVYNMNGAHLAPEALTVFERLDDAGLRTAGTTYLIYRGRHRHEPQRDSALTRIAALGARAPAGAGAARALLRRHLREPRHRLPPHARHARRARPPRGLRRRSTSSSTTCSTSCCSRCPTTTTTRTARPRRPGRLDRRRPTASSRGCSPRPAASTRSCAEHAVIVVADHAHTLVERAVSLARGAREFTCSPPDDGIRADAPDRRLPGPALGDDLRARRGRRELLLRASSRARRARGRRARDVARERRRAARGRRGERGARRAALRARRRAARRPRGALERRGRARGARRPRRRRRACCTPDFPDALGRVWDALRVPDGRRGAAVRGPASSSPTGAARPTSAAAATARCPRATRSAADLLRRRPESREARRSGRSRTSTRDRRPLRPRGAAG